MKNAELHASFLQEFEALLKKYDAEFNTVTHTKGYSSLDIPTVSFNGQFEDGKITREFSELEIVSCIP